jgi:tRNA threonylcarbamoyl adenosine modification protein (Sua5/YciO/YrdC/YwlC family)
MLDPNRAEDLQAAVDRILGGGIVAIPTDTVYGLAALPTHEAALGALGDLKGRDRDQPIAVLIDSVADVIPYLETPHSLDPYIRFWPGALTVIVRARAGEGGLAPPVVSAQGTVGIRKPDDRVARALIRACGGILAVTSANRHGQEPATSATEVAAEFGAGFLILDGGERPGGTASTVVDASEGGPRIVRHGQVTAADLGIADPGIEAPTEDTP